eukprot:COSAG02_NODE_148_length_33809_cov_158.369594_6_plen_98_part_00
MEPWIGGTTGTWRPVVKDLLVQQHYSITVNYAALVEIEDTGQPGGAKWWGRRIDRSHLFIGEIRYFSFFAFHILDTLDNLLCFTSSVSFTILGFSRV